MRSTIFASILAFAASALAQDATAGYAVISAPSNGEVVPSGETFTIKWSAGKFSGPATISLMGGNDPTTLQVLNAIATGVEVTTESFAWAVACSLGTDKTYGLKIADQATNGATFQYSFPFAIKGPSCGSSSSSSSSSSATASTSATASASGYPTKVETTTSAPGYPVQTSSSIAHTSTTVSLSSSIYSNSTTTAKSYPSTTLATQTTPVAYVTETSAVVGSSSSAPTSSTTGPVTVPTAGAARTGAGLALGLLAAAIAL
ncbi:Ser-Thr-rich glycosyl-phosphatidyl-inositol-anchored membrane family-domain-containing protein [Xylaria cf. heliscus]|nr:Ser-Thr-rich glycosyl-phosphatidyl-inositol-anchored membrane family-domain-containing protein [Xylaria cf. heliscus]